MDLWPYRLKLLLPFELEGRKTRVGDSAIFLGLEGDQLFIRLEGTDLAINVQPQETDIMSQARTILEEPRGASGRVLDEVAGKLVSSITGRQVTLDPDSRPEYVVMYMGAGWCGPCQVFSPELVKLVKAKSPKPSDVVLLYLSGDRNPLEAKNYITKLGIDWPTLYFRNRGQLPAFAPLFGDTIPQLVVTDRHGKVVIDSNKVGTARALAQLKQLL
jgi:thiol-disulfide isomerase/thioredoxin